MSHGNKMVHGTFSCVLRISRQTLPSHAPSTHTASNRVSHMFLVRAPLVLALWTVAARAVDPAAEAVRLQTITRSTGACPTNVATLALARRQAPACRSRSVLSAPPGGC